MQGMARWLRDNSLTTQDVLYSPLECVAACWRDDFEMRWTLRLKTHDGKGFNAFGAYGNPTRQKRFWQRRHFQCHAGRRRCPSTTACNLNTDHGMLHSAAIRADGEYQVVGMLDFDDDSARVTGPKLAITLDSSDDSD